MQEQNPASPLPPTAAAASDSVPVPTPEHAPTLTPAPAPSPVAPTPPKLARYVDLGDTAPAYSTWLNDPSYMKLETYFAEDQKAAPGLTASFGLKDLKPILVKPDTQEGNTYLITDGIGYWMFNELEGRMWKFKNKSLTQSMVVDLVDEERYDGRDLAEQLRPKTQSFHSRGLK